METLQPDSLTEVNSLTKSAKKKKEQDSQAVKHNRKISDFFKTPEKQVDKQKQKSLLQFFAKSGEENEGQSEDNSKAAVDEVIANSGEITTPTNSDKENSEVQEEKVASDEGECMSKSKKQQKERGIDKSIDEIRKSQKLKSSDTGNESKKHRKQKKKTKLQEDRTEDSLSDSVIILSDSSLSQPETGNSDKLKDDADDKNLDTEFREEQITGKINVDDEMEHVVESGIHSKSVFSKTEWKDSKETEIDDVTEVDKKEKDAYKLENESIDQMKKGSGSKTKENHQVSRALDMNKSKNTSENPLENLSCKDKHDKKKKLKKNSNRSEIKHSKSEGMEVKPEEGKELTETQATAQTGKLRNENLTSEKSKSKKSALKVKDMLNLLKEIQSTESEDAKKRKGKRKHKHKIKETKNKDVFEIAISEDNSDGKEETNPTKKHCEEMGEKLKEMSDPKETIDSKSIGDETDKKLEKGVCQRDGNRRSRKNRAVVDKEKGDINDKQIRKSGNTAKLKKEKLKKKTLAQKRSIKGDLPDSEIKLSYEDFTETLGGKTLQIVPEMKKENSTKEMSYTEYLQLIEKGSGEAIVDSCDYDNENADETIAVDEEKVLKNSAVSGEDIVEEELKPEKSRVKKFFAIMTSTPDREKVTKNSKKVLSRKKGAFVKSDTDKVKTETSQSTDGEVVEIRMDVDEKEDIEAFDSKKEAECNENIKKVDTPSKGQCTGKKTQATLSFGKTGLTVSKPVSKSDEEESTDVNKKSVKSDKSDNLDKGKTEERKAATPGRGRKSRKNTTDLNNTDGSVFATPENARKRVKRKLEEEDSESTEGEERRRSLRKRYKVEAFQMDADKKTPIKIKLKRCPKSSSSGEDSERSTHNIQKVKVNVKQSTAQALLEKAKRGKLKKNKLTNNKDKTKLMKRKESKKKEKCRNESNSSEDSVTRRSSRLEGRIMASMEEVSLENIVISSSEDEGQEEKPVRKRGRPKGSKNRAQSPKKDVKESTETCKGTPKKCIVKTKSGTPSKNRTPSKKSGMKLAPMFLIGKNKPAEPSPKKVVLDPETLKQRQAFLMSGVPEELRKQTTSKIVSQVDGDYPPIPRTSHVVQAPVDLTSQQSSMVNVWDLRPIELSLRHLVMPISVNPTARFSGDLMVRNQSKSKNVDKFKDFRSHVPICTDMVELCLKEIAAFNSTYPVTTMYKALKEMKIEAEQPPPASESMLRTDMKGILDGCTDMMVIDEDEDSGQKKRKKKLKLQKKPEQNIEEPKVEEKSKPTGSGLLWTEKYCPGKTADVLGNSGVLKKLKTWLTEWKHVLDREARKARKLLMKKNKGKQLPSKKVDDDLWDDDSDFDLDCDDSDEDDSLCNTMLLTGPHGCGKTSSVYALALEMGFKVHEVNASSCRSGKQILSQLQEATQSHQVSSQGNHTPRKNLALGDKPKAENKMPTAFTNLFKKAVPAAENKQDEKQAGKKRKRNASEKDGSSRGKRKTGEKRNTEMKHKSLQLMIEDSSSQNVSKSLNLSSTTLILFDEVDVVFEEDKGFLSAIQNFMSHTKIPIILTTADPGFTDTFEGRYEQMNFKRPSVASVTTHLQTVSLVENVRTDPVTLAQLAQFYSCDMRRCLVALQFLLESGGGHSCTYKVIRTSEHSQNTTVILGLQNENSQSNLPGDSCVTLDTEHKVTAEENGEASRDVDNSDDDFVAIKPLKKRRRVLDDDNSNSVDNRLQVTVHKPAEVTAVEDSSEAKNYPVVHGVGLESLMCSKELFIADSLTQGLKTKSSEASLQDLICTCCCIKQTSNTDLMYANLHLLLPFETKLVDSILKVSNDCSNSKTKARKRIRIQSDLYDSEASNDAVEVDNHDDKQDEGVEADTETKNVVKENRSENICVAKSLSCFTRFYDTMSSLDVQESTDRMKVCDKLQNMLGRDVKGTLVAGMENELANFRTHCEVDLETSRLYSSEIETRSMYKLYNETSVLEEEMKQLCTENEIFAENFTLPVRRKDEHFTLVDSSSISVPVEYRRACDNTVDNLPLVSQSHLRRVHLDYLPTLREICRSEQCRQLTNTKRRFHHYLDNITLPLKDRTVSTLATTFV